MSISEIIKNGATLVDVRTPAEFAYGSVPNSINIPLNEIPVRVDEFKSMKQPIVLFCQSGNRSYQAQMFLDNKGVKTENGGSWLNVNYALSELTHQ